MILNSTTKQDCGFFSLTGGFASCLHYCFTVSNYWAVKCQMVNKLPHCYSGAPTGASVEEGLMFYETAGHTLAAHGYSHITR